MPVLYRECLYAGEIPPFPNGRRRMGGVYPPQAHIAQRPGRHICVMLVEGERHERVKMLRGELQVTVQEGRDQLEVGPTGTREIGDCSLRARSFEMRREVLVGNGARRAPPP
jgi:hypothetical protein